MSSLCAVLRTVERVNAGVIRGIDHAFDDRIGLAPPSLELNFDPSVLRSGLDKLLQLGNTSEDLRSRSSERQFWPVER